MRVLVCALAACAFGCTQILGGSELDDVHPIAQSVVPDAGPTEDAAQTQQGPAPDAGGGHPDAATGPQDCTGPLAAGDLAIVELMIASQSGPNDGGEWLEVKSTRSCRLNLKGLHAESPRGASYTDTLDVADDAWLAPGGTFVIADNADPTTNHDLPGTVLAWAGSPSPTDTLKNSGDSVTLSANGVTIDTVSYSGLAWTAGTSVAFPSGCVAQQRTDWSKWGNSTKSWSGAFHGTPNATNDDIACP
jgi:hypothetical protein